MPRENIKFPGSSLLSHSKIFISWETTSLLLKTLIFKDPESPKRFESIS